MRECQQRILAGKPTKVRIFDETFSFRSMTYPENIAISIENLILHITQTISE